jgi:hypothetical protein
MIHFSLPERVDVIHTPDPSSRVVVASSSRVADRDARDRARCRTYTHTCVA